MIPKMVIAVANADIESYTTIKFLQIVLDIRTVLNNEINYIQITMSRSCIISVIQSQQSHC